MSCSSSWSLADWPSPLASFDIGMLRDLMMSLLLWLWGAVGVGLLGAVRIIMWMAARFTLSWKFSNDRFRFEQSRNPACPNRVPVHVRKRLKKLRVRKPANENLPGSTVLASRMSLRLNQRDLIPQIKRYHREFRRHAPVVVSRGLAAWEEIATVTPGTVHTVKTYGKVNWHKNHWSWGVWVNFPPTPSNQRRQLIQHLHEESVPQA